MAKNFSLEVSEAAKALLAQLKQSDVFVKGCRKKVEEINNKYKHEQ